MISSSKNICNDLNRAMSAPGYDKRGRETRTRRISSQFMKYSSEFYNRTGV